MLIRPDKRSSLMNDKQTIFTLISDIQREIPREILDILMVDKITLDNFDKHMVNYLRDFPPNYLPVLEKDENIFAIHMKPNCPWQECAWVVLPHDSEFLQVIANSFYEFPYAFFTSQLNRRDCVGEIISYVNNMIRKDLPKVDKEFVNSNIEDDALKIRGTL